MMTHRAERGDEEINVLRFPARLGRDENRDDQQRGADVKDEVAPTIENPRVGRPGSCWHSRDSLGIRKCGDALHVWFWRREFSSVHEKNQLRSRDPVIYLLIVSRIGKLTASLQFIEQQRAAVLCPQIYHPARSRLFACRRILWSKSCCRFDRKEPVRESRSRHFLVR